MPSPLSLHLGVKTDPIEYRYSWQWLFRILVEEDVHYLQLGTFFEIYQLPDDFFLKLRDQAAQFGLQISSVFTAHRELGGLFSCDPALEQVAFHSYKRLIQVGALVGARSVGSNPGAVLRDQMELKEAGIQSYITNMKKLMHHANECGVEILGIEPMSCLAEPPTLPSEILDFAEELLAYHRKHPHSTSRVGYCFDVSHGYLDADGKVRYNNLELLQTALPYITEMHLKNTDELLEATLGFSRDERAHGIVDIERVRDFLLENADLLPVRELIGYLEISGPKRGRDCTDRKLEDMLRVSIRHLRETFLTARSEKEKVEPGKEAVLPRALPGSSECSSPSPVKISSSMMCADMSRLHEEILRLERLGVAMLHWDIMDAHFVPNMPCGLALLQELRDRTSLPFDVHLMVENNEFFIRELAKIGVEMISVHSEADRHCDRTLSLIRQSGAKAGLALNPSTSLGVLEYLTERLDFVLLMTVNPGFAGQELTPSGLSKIADCRTWLNNRGLDVPIEVDGNVSFENMPKMVAAGANILAVGSSSLFYQGASRVENMKKIQDAVEHGLRMRTEGRSRCGTRTPGGQP
jgi:ribulose-phosphate 3-epimerase